MSTLERGFKTWAERTATSLRKELGLPGHAPLHPLRLATFLDVQLWTPNDVPGLSQTALDQLLIRDPWGWSAVSCVVDDHNVVIYNPRHSSARQASNISHELAHIILDHEPGKMVLSQDGSIVMRSYDAKQEAEADWLGWCILLPRQALEHVVRNGLSTADIASTYGVSEKLAEYRLRMTGVDYQFRRSRRATRPPFGLPPAKPGRSA
jgi:IrrE N-terminal-like domain